MKFTKLLFSFSHKRSALTDITKLMSCIALVLGLSLAGCSRQSNSSSNHVITIESKAYANTLFYSGTIQPFKTLVVTTPADGAVTEMPFQYGESVNSGQLLFMISSAKFLTDYKAALMAYIKAKSDFNNAKMQFSEAEFLHKNQLISDDDFKMKKSSYYTAQLGLLQSKDALENLLKQSDIKDINLNELSIANVDKIMQALRLQASSENLRIIAPANGIILASSKNEEESKKIAKGDVVKQGDVLAVIGDMNGLSVRIKVNELTVNQLKIGQKVEVSGIAFPDYTLKGEISRIDRQGESTSGGLPTFSVLVIVPKLTSQEQKTIHVGMSAKVEIKIEEEPQILVPIGALFEKNGNSYVQVFDKHKKVQEVAVKTGKTTVDSVAILAGLKAGDKIVVAN